MRPVVIAGARPNFVKVAPILAEFERRGIEADLVHTGQHYDEAMSGSFFSDLGMPAPSANLDVGSGSHAVQTARVMERFDEWLDGHPADCVIVVGDVNSSLACALVAVKRGIRVAHVEAGLRSLDRSMPEEINRLAIDVIADVLFAPSADGVAHLLREGTDPSRIHLVGNIMADSLFAARSRASASTVLDDLGIGRPFGLVTLHRPALVDDDTLLKEVLGALVVTAKTTPLVFPVHPRARARIEAIVGPNDRLQLFEPQGYLDFVRLETDAAFVITDSGGVQEETTMLGVPCITVRENTERPITITEGTNVLVGFDPDKIVAAAAAALDPPTQRRCPALWDGRTAERVVEVIVRAAGAI